MSDDIEASCIRKRGNNFKPHERIEGLGGMHNGQRWYMLEEDIIAELERPAASRRWAFYVSVGGHSTWAVVATHEGRKYLKTQADKFSPDTLLALAQCPSR